MAVARMLLYLYSPTYYAKDPSFDPLEIIRNQDCEMMLYADVKDMNFGRDYFVKATQEASANFD